MINLLFSRFGKMPGGGNTEQIPQPVRWANLYAPTKKPAQLSLKRVALALAVFIKRPQAEIKSAQH
jgi:hypothetical protein